MHRFVWKRGLLFALFVAAVVSSPTLCPAAEIVVNSTGDELADTTSCTLRDAVQAATQNVEVDGCVSGETGPDSIHLMDSTYTLTQGTLVIASEINLLGQGNEFTIITTTGTTERALEVSLSGILSLHDLSIRNVDAGEDGGGILVKGTLTAESVRFTGNTTTLDGGAAAVTGEATFSNCLFDSNWAEGSAGGLLCTGGDVVVHRTKFQGNGAGTQGGATGVESNGTLVLDSCLLIENTALRGGASWGSNGVSTTRFVNTTVTQNQAAEEGGAIYGTLNPDMHLSHATVTRNEAPIGGGLGGLIDLSAVNSIIAMNSAFEGPDCFLSATPLQERRVLISNNQGCIVFNDPTDILGDPLLHALADNGGPTMTHGVDAGPAIGTGDCMDTLGNFLSFDQRGAPRSSVGDCTLGAYEFITLVPVLIDLLNEPSGIHCIHGGTKMQIGLDYNENGTLDSNEIGAVQYVCNGADGIDGDNPLVRMTPEVPGTNCVHGGQRVAIGIDDNGNGSLDSLETDSIHYLCNGADGADGADGTNGADGIDGVDALQPLVTVTQVETSTDCPYGGVRIDIGYDSDQSGTLETEEVSETRYVCDGEPGLSDTPPLVAVTQVTSGGDCVYGGQRIDVGLDWNQDGEVNPAEITSTEYICVLQPGYAGLQPIVHFTEEPAGIACAFGGQRMDVGLDQDADGILDDDEIVATYFLCNGDNGESGNDGSDGLQPLISITSEPAGAVCPLGGQRIDVGLDVDDDGILDPVEVKSTRYICNGDSGPAGPASLVQTVEELPGANCKDGGMRFILGTDLNDNGVLDSNEVSLSDYLCNGEDGAPGNPGEVGAQPMVNITDEGAGSDCPAGGIRLDTGLDTNGDGNLQPAEITATQFVCDGEKGDLSVQDAPAGGGSGGCSTGAQPWSLFPLWLLLLGLVAIHRRNRRTTSSQT